MIHLDVYFYDFFFCLFISFTIVLDHPIVLYHALRPYIWSYNIVIRLYKIQISHINCTDGRHILNGSVKMVHLFICCKWTWTAVLYVQTKLKRAHSRIYLFILLSIGFVLWIFIFYVLQFVSFLILVNPFRLIFRILLKLILLSILITKIKNVYNKM